MTARHYYRFDQDEAVAEVPGVLRWEYTGAQKAEEGEAGTYEIIVDDPDSTLDFVGHRRWTVYEDESVDDNEVVIDGLTQAVNVAHKGGTITQPQGRVWTIEVADMNTLFTYRVMVGADSQFPDDQTDVDRVLQVAESEEMGYFSDLTLVNAGSTVTMDEYDGRGQYTGAIMDSCAQQSGKNWYIGSYGVHGEYSADFFLWYGHDSLTAYESPLSLSNDPDDLDMPATDDGTTTVYPLGADTKLRRDYARQYSGAYGEYKNGSKYISQDANPYAPDFTVTGRDIAHPAPDIATATRMKARLLRQLRDASTPDEVISTTITLPANRVSQLRPGMRIAFKATHLPGYEEFRYLRILSTMPRPIGRKYEVAIELQGPGLLGSVASCSTSVSTSEDHVSTGTGTSPSDTITPSEDSTVLAFLLGMNSNTPSATDMTAITGYTDIFDIADAHRSTYRIASKAVSGGVGSTAAATFTGGFGGKDVWIATQVALPGSWTLVQQKDASAVGTAQEAVFDSTPATGNLIVMFCHAEVTNVGVITPGGSTGPSDGWTLIGADTHTKYPGEPDSEWVATAVYARCVDAGDGSVYGFTGEGNSNSVWLGELGL